MRKKRPLVTKAECREFVKGLRHWCQEFGLRDWDVRTKEENEPDKDRIASVDIDIEARVAIAEVNRGRKCPHSMRRVACHEALHVVLEPLSNLAKERYATEREIDQEVERLCTLFEQVLCEKEEG